MKILSNIYTFKTRNFAVRVDALPEHDPDFSFDETGETQEKIASGEWEIFRAKASVLFRGHEIGSDYLGNCIHANFSDFRDHVGSKGKHGSYFSDMIRQSISEARAEIKNLQSVNLRN